MMFGAKQHLFAFLLMLAFLLPVGAFAQSSPLIMKHADNLAVARKKGSLLLVYIVQHRLEVN